MYRISASYERTKQSMELSLRWHKDVRPHSIKELIWSLNNPRGIYENLRKICTYN